MKTLGIFGDSFAAEWTISSYGVDQSWPMQIKKYYSVTNYAECGSSLEYSIDLLTKHHHKFDQVLFVTTCHPRLFYSKDFIPKVGEQPIINKWWVCDEQCKHMQYHFENTDSFLSNMEWTLDILKNNGPMKQHIDVQYTSLVRYITTIRSDSVLIPGAGIGRNFKFWESLGYTWDISYLTGYEISKITISDDDRVCHDGRPNHLSIENNKWMLEHVNDRLNNIFKDWSPTDSYYFKDAQEFAKYRF